MLELLAAGTGGAIMWADLGLVKGIDLGFFTLRFYSLAYLFGLLLAYWHLRKMIAAPGAPLAKNHADDLFFYCMIGVIVGGRLGYVCLLYTS
ncbi:MAG: prolipoprotein diacylglyceryl transferase, partial [Alteraurantiacibacter sp.]|nr:prolipoprotein diacylglyceryl transferase [Alteraurantiacibacter sp.]